MLAVGFRFLSGRYHGNPWGRHVNEADVGWPPDAWRISRALIATWHAKLAVAAFPRERLVDLLAALASDVPVYSLPAAVHAHTRHYMPGKGAGKTSLIFDAFAQVGREAQLLVIWQQVELSAAQNELLDALLAVLGYLGRAESWVAATRLADWSGPVNCYPAESTVDPHTGEAGDLVPLWLPHTAEQYAGVRELQLAAARARAQAVALEKQAAALAAGKQAAALPPAKIPAAVRATLPADWLDALSLDTGELQAAGWSAPPAARQVYYWRPKEALGFTSARLAVVPPATQATATTARFALYGKPLPRLFDAVRVGERLRLALMGQARRLFGEGLPSCLSGHDLPAGNRHGHAFFLPEPNRAGRIDHLIVHAEAGLDVRAIAAITELAEVRSWQVGQREEGGAGRAAAEPGTWRVLLEGVGERAAFAPHSRLLGESTDWVSVTPYLHPWHLKKGFETADQLRKECRLRGISQLPLVEPIAVPTPRPLQFYRFRSKRNLSQPDRHGQMLRLRFAEPVAGPLAFGFGCHFGLGLFRAVSPEHEVRDDRHAAAANSDADHISDTGSSKPRETG